MVKLSGVSRKSLLTHPGLTTKRHQSRPAPRSITRICGASPSTTLGIYNGDIDTLECALLERMYYCQQGDTFVGVPPVEPTVVADRLDAFRSAVFREHGYFTPVTLDDFVEMYKGPKKLLYSRAVESLSTMPVRRADATSKSFVKVEKGNPAKAPRVIQPRDPRYNAELGRYIKPIEHTLYQAIARVFGDGPTVMKGYNLEDVARISKAKWDSFDDPVAVGLDAKRFDMHVTLELLEGFEHKIYRDIFGWSDSNLAKLLEWQVHNRGVGYADDGSLRYRVDGKRFSGDMNTALGNCLIMCAMVWSYSRCRGVHTKLINNGDDCVVFMEREDLPAFSMGLSDWFQDLGFRMTVEEPAFSFEELEFCQMHPVHCSGGWRMVRNVRTSLEKDSLCTRPILDYTTLQGWFTAVGDGGVAVAAGVPILQEFYQMYLRWGGGRQSRILANEVCGMTFLSRGLVKETREVTEEARYSFFCAFGILPDTQLAVEEYFRNLDFSYSEAIEPWDALLGLDDQSSI